MSEGIGTDYGSAVYSRMSLCRYHIHTLHYLQSIPGHACRRCRDYAGPICDWVFHPCVHFLSDGIRWADATTWRLLWEVKTPHVCLAGLLVCHFIMTFLFIILSFANSIYLLKYLISLFSGVMTWKYCKPSWAKINCYELGDQNSAYQTCVRVHSEEFCKNLTWETSGHQFWKWVI